MKCPYCGDEMIRGYLMSSRDITFAVDNPTKVFFVLKNRTIGHMAVEREGLSCSCGNYGCLNLYASGRAIELEAKKVVEAHEESLLTDLVYGNADRVDLNVVFEAALGDDRIALDILEKAAG